MTLPGQIIVPSPHLTGSRRSGERNVVQSVAGPNRRGTQSAQWLGVTVPFLCGGEGCICSWSEAQVHRPETLFWLATALATLSRHIAPIRRMVLLLRAA